MSQVIFPQPFDLLVPRGGTKVIDDTSAYTNLTGIAIDCVATAVVSVCTGFDDAGNAYNFKTTNNWDNLTTGYTYFVPRNYVITAITLSSGTINLHQY